MWPWSKKKTNQAPKAQAAPIKSKYDLRFERDMATLELLVKTGSTTKEFLYRAKDDHGFDYKMALITEYLKNHPGAIYKH